MSNHFAILTINWATRVLDYEGLTGDPAEELSLHQCIARLEEHSRGLDRDVIEMWAVAFMDGETVVHRGDVVSMKQMELYSAADLREAFLLSSSEPEGSEDDSQTADRRCPSV